MIIGLFIIFDLCRALWKLEYSKVDWEMLIKFAFFAGWELLVWDCCLFFLMKGF